MVDLIASRNNGNLDRTTHRLWFFHLFIPLIARRVSVNLCFITKRRCSPKKLRSERLLNEVVHYLQWKRTERLCILFVSYSMCTVFFKFECGSLVVCVRASVYSHRKSFHWKYNYTHIINTYSRNWVVKV